MVLFLQRSRRRNSHRHVPASESFPHWRDKVRSPLIDVVNSLKIHLQLQAATHGCFMSADQLEGLNIFKQVKGDPGPAYRQYSFWSRLLLRFWTASHLFSFTPLDRSDGRSLARSWFWRSRICSKTSHNTWNLIGGFSFRIPRCPILKTTSDNVNPA